MNIFVDLIPQMNRTFFHYLCKNFRVYAVKGLYDDFAKLYGEEDLLNLEVKLVDDIVRMDEDRVGELISHRVNDYLGYLEGKMPDVLGPQITPSLGRDDVSSAGRTAYGVLRGAMVFRELTNHVTIDLVIVNSDWIHTRRAIVLEAKRLGIPTLNIEHGHYSLQPEYDAFKRRPELRFVSDIVNLDNEIELSIIKEYYDRSGFGEDKTFVVNGTPNDLSHDRTITPMVAREKLKLKADSFVITVGASWLPMMAASFAFRRQIELVDTYRSILKVLKRLEETNRIEVIIKLHPKSSYTGSFSDEKKYLEVMAKDLGVSVALITDQDLPDVLAATDLLVCTGLSSVLWDAAAASIPGIRYLQPGYVRENFHQDLLQTKNPFFHADCAHYVFSENELLEKVEHYLDEKNYIAFQKRIEATRKKFKVEDQLVEEKCERICEWVKSYLTNKAANAQTDSV